MPFDEFSFARTSIRQYHAIMAISALKPTRIQLPWPDPPTLLPLVVQIIRFVPGSDGASRPVPDLRFRPGLPVGADANRGPQDADGGGGCRHPLVALLGYRVRRTSGIVGYSGRERPNHGCSNFGIHQLPDESVSIGDRRACTRRLFCRYGGAHSVLVQ